MSEAGSGIYETVPEMGDGLYEYVADVNMYGVDTMPPKRFFY